MPRLISAGLLVEIFCFGKIDCEKCSSRWDRSLDISVTVAVG